MEAKEYLEQPLRLEQTIRSRKTEMDELRMELENGVSSVGFEQHYSSNPNTHSPHEYAILRITELEDQISDYRKEQVLLMSEVGHSIDLLSDVKEQQVLRYRYLNFLSVEQIARKMNYSPRWVKKLHSRALESFERGHPEFTLCSLSIPETLC